MVPSHSTFASTRSFPLCSKFISSSFLFLYQFLHHFFSAAYAITFHSLQKASKSSSQQLPSSFIVSSYFFAMPIMISSDIMPHSDFRFSRIYTIIINYFIDLIRHLDCIADFLSFETNLNF